MSLTNVFPSARQYNDAEAQTYQPLYPVTPTAENFRRSRIFLNFSKTFPTKLTPGWLGKYILKKSKM